MIIQSVEKKKEDLSGHTLSVMKRNEDVAGGGGHFKASVSSELQASYQNGGGGGGGLQRPTIMASTSGGGGGGSSVAASALANVKYEHLVAGISGGIASTLALHPLDLLKVRLAGKRWFSVFGQVL